MPQEIYYCSATGRLCAYTGFLILLGGDGLNSIMKLFDDYRFKRLEIKRLKADKCIVTDSVQSSDMDAPYTKCHVKISGVDSEKKRRNRERIERLEAECAYVEATVALAPNSRVKMILELKYFDGLTWAEVVSRLADEGIELSEAACKQQVYRYLEKVEQSVKSKAK